MSRIVFLLIFLAHSPLLAQPAALSAFVDEQPVALSALASQLKWRAAQPGLDWTEIELRAGRWRLPVRAIVTRIDPRAFTFELTLSTRANGMTGAWNVDSAGADVALALNAGQFKETGPWGWLVLNAYEKRDPGHGPLSAGIAIDTAGAVRWYAPAQLAAARHDRSIRFAFQSYPLLLLNGVVPRLLTSSDDVNRTHRDARLILGELADGSLLVVLTRSAAFAAVTERVPIGLTVPESLELVTALGTRHALMLDGGISAQLLLRTAADSVIVWKGLRKVPLALLARPRQR
ncbi:MAG: phosphodiester glycosidase family protein [Gemmatimonadota bacterium]